MLAYPLGYITPEDRTQQQQDAHAAALAAMPRFALPFTEPGGPVKVDLTRYWKRPEAIEDIGFEFDGFHQLTGSCVGASEGDGICTLSCIQRCIGETPTKAFIPWWPFPYGRCRLAGGATRKGEGAVTSLMSQVLVREGCFNAGRPELPNFHRGDGLYLSEQTELDWSDGDSSLVEAWINIAREFPLGSCSPVYDAQSIRAGIINGYPCLNGCNLYVGSGQIHGEGENAYVRGAYDGRGGHATCFLGYWDHPDNGPLYLYSNQWPTSTYPRDPAGGGRCCIWIPESEVMKAFSQYGMGGGECMLMSHLTYTPAQPKVLDWFV